MPYLQVYLVRSHTWFAHCLLLEDAFSILVPLYWQTLPNMLNLDYKACMTCPHCYSYSKWQVKPNIIIKQCLARSSILNFLKDTPITLLNIFISFTRYTQPRLLDLHNFSYTPPLWWTSWSCHKLSRNQACYDQMDVYLASILWKLWVG